MPTLILFDLGHTLLYLTEDWKRVFERALQSVPAALESAGYPGDAVQAAARLRQVLERYYAERDKDLNEVQAAQTFRKAFKEFAGRKKQDRFAQAALESFYRTTQAHWLPEPDAAPTMQALRGRGVRLGVVSNAANDQDVQTLVDQAGLRPYLEIVLSSAAVGRRKPAPLIFRTALRALEAQAGEAWMVGDTYTADILGARNAGLRPIWITRRVMNLPPVDLVPDREPVERIESLAELLDLI